MGIPTTCCLRAKNKRSLIVENSNFKISATYYTIFNLGRHRIVFRVWRLTLAVMEFDFNSMFFNVYSEKLNATYRYQMHLVRPRNGQWGQDAVAAVCSMVAKMHCIVVYEDRKSLKFVDVRIENEFTLKNSFEWSVRTGFQVSLSLSLRRQQFLL